MQKSGSMLDFKATGRGSMVMQRSRKKLDFKATGSESVGRRWHEVWSVCDRKPGKKATSKLCDAKRVVGSFISKPQDEKVWGDNGMRSGLTVT